MSTSIEFRNLSRLTVDIYWRDGDENERHYASLLPYASYTQQTYASHEWIVRDKRSGHMLAQLTAQKDPIEFDIEVSDQNHPLRSENSDREVRLTFSNRTELALALYWLDYNGDEKHYCNLRPGDQYTQSTFAGHPWRVRAINSGAEMAIYIPDERAEQHAEIMLASMESVRPITLEFVNDSPLTLQLQWQDFEGVAQPYTTLQPGQTHEQPTFTSHPWVLVDQHSGVVVEYITASFTDQKHVVTTQHVRSLGGVQATSLQFQNLMPHPIDLFWVDYDGVEQRYASMQLGESYSVGSFASHPWRARHTRTGEVVGLFIPSGETSQQHAFSVSTYSGNSPATVRLANKTQLTVSVRLVADDGKEYTLKILNPREVEELGLFESAKLVVRDTYSHHQVNKFAVAESETLLGETRSPGSVFAEDLVIDGLDAKSQPDTHAVNVTFENGSPFDVKVLWVDFEGREIEYATLKPGDRYVQGTYAGHLWRIREVYTRRIIGLFIANEEAEQHTVYAVKSRLANKHTGITFENKSMLTVEVIWLDYAGKEQHYKTLLPGASFGLKTYVTHPWIVRDSQSRRLLDWNWGDLEQQHMTIDDVDIKPREGSNEVSVAFTNRLPFAVDVYWLAYDGQEKLYATLDQGESHRQSTYETHPWRVRQQHSGDEIGLYIANSDSEQAFDVSLRSLASDVATDIEFINVSLLHVGIYWIDYNGKEVEYARLQPRESFNQTTYMTHPWVARDLNSSEALGFTVGAREPQSFNITGRATRSRRGTPAVNLTLKNNTGYDVEIDWVDFAGEEVNYASLSPGQVFSVSSFEYHTWRAREKHSRAEVDLYIANGDSEQIHSITNSLVRTRERENAVLWPGEVALYEKPNYQGRVWILHSDVPEFTRIQGLNDTVSSLRLGPDTAVTLFRDVDYGGTNDVFHLDTTSLAETDVGNDSLSSIQLLTTVQKQNSTISSTSRLTEEHSEPVNGQLVSKPVYRSIVTVPAITGAIDVWATEELDISIEGKIFTVDPVRSARFTPNLMGKLIITITPDQLGKAALMLRTSAMAERERFFVFPDADIHTKVLKLEDDSLWDNRAALGIHPNITRADVGQVQSAMRSLSATVPSATRSLSHGVSRDRFVVADTMPFKSWALDLGGTEHEGAVMFRPVSAQELAGVNAGAIRVDEQIGQGLFDSWDDFKSEVSTFVVETVPATAVSAANATADFVVEDVGDTLADAGKAVVDVARPVVKEIGNTAGHVWNTSSSWVEQAAEDSGKFVVKTAEEIAQTAVNVGETLVDAAEETGEFFQKTAVGAVKALEDAVDQVIRITVEVSGKAYQFIVDTVEKVGQFVQKVIEAVGVAWDKFVEFMKDIFSWDDILHTHDYFVHNVNGGIDLMQSTLTSLQSDFRGLIADAQENVIEGMDSMLDQLGVSEITKVTRSAGIDTSDMSDKLDWLMSHVIDDDSDAGAGSDKSIDNPMLDRIMSVVPQSLKDQLSNLLIKLVDLIQDFVEEDLPVVIDAFLDSMALLQQALADPARAKELVLGAVLSIAKSLTVAGLGIIDVVVTLLFEFVVAAIELLQVALNESIDIPVLSALYRILTKGRELSAISLFSLILAVPTTIMSKIIIGNAPFQQSGNLAQGDETQAEFPQKLTTTEHGKREIHQHWAIGYGCLHALMLITDLVGDVQGGAQKKNKGETHVGDEKVPARDIKIGDKKVWRNSAEMKKVTITLEPAQRFSDRFPVKKGGGMSTGMLILESLGLVSGIFAQVAGNPIGHVGNSSLSHENLQKLKEGGPDTQGYWGYMVWNYQWIYPCVGVLDFVIRALRHNGVGIPKQVTDYGIPALTTASGIVHMGMMSKLVNIEKKSDGGYSKVNGRRHGGYMFDTLPGITKVLVLKELNQDAYYIPLAIHSILFVTLGHLGEAIVYWSRAGVDVDGEWYDLTDPEQGLAGSRALSST